MTGPMRNFCGHSLTMEDEGIYRHDLDISFWEEYELSISDRNDAALMKSLTVLSKDGCRSIKNRLAAAA
ncbi:MAG: hypothetical protein A2V79_11675 [Betaproteobacteria bacterium RBG_16_56_24]|nr:MAG: hypothetical protein A2V79_11675 [Betaproteobacteria bacterium RBG_16_56_24]